MLNLHSKQLVSTESFCLISVCVALSLGIDTHHHASQFINVASPYSCSLVSSEMGKFQITAFRPLAHNAPGFMPKHILHLKLPITTLFFFP